MRLSVKVGDLVKFPKSKAYWWSDKVGIIDRKESVDGHPVEYRVLVPPNRYVRFNDSGFVELISESR